jgi:prepilin-type processing-associated H-X9-DG protein
MPPQNYRPPQRQTTYRPGPPPKGGSPLGPIMAVLIGVAVVVAAAVVVVPMFKNVKSVASQSDCFANLHDQQKGFMMYTQDYDAQTPPASCWALATQPYVKHWMVCPVLDERLGANTKNTGYAMHSQLAGVRLSQISQPSSALLFYDTSASGRNACDAGTSLPVPGRHGGFNSLCFVDGHTEKK